MSERRGVHCGDSSSRRRYWGRCAPSRQTTEHISQTVKWGSPSQESSIIEDKSTTTEKSNSKRHTWIPRSRHSRLKMAVLDKTVVLTSIFLSSFLYSGTHSEICSRHKGYCELNKCGSCLLDLTLQWGRQTFIMISTQTDVLSWPVIKSKSQKFLGLWIW